MVKRVGFIGLGIMGKPMARNLMKAGYPVTVYNRTRSKMNELVDNGATAAKSPREVAETSDIVITMVTDSRAVQEVVLGPEGVLKGAHKGMTLIDMSTIEPQIDREIAEKLSARGARMLDAPVSGGQKGAVEGTLSIMVGGEKEIFENCLEILQILGKNIVHVGDIGMGQTVKACNQIIVALTLEAIGEAFVLGTKAGLDPELLLNALRGGFADSRVLQVRGPDILDRDFSPGFRTVLHHKDLGIALSAGKELGVPLPVTSLVHQMFGALKTIGRGEYDHSGIITLLEDMAKVKVKRKNQ